MTDLCVYLSFLRSLFVTWFIIICFGNRPAAGEVICLINSSCIRCRDLLIAIYYNLKLKMFQDFRQRQAWFLWHCLKWKLHGRMLISPPQLFLSYHANGLEISESIKTFMLNCLQG